MSTGGSSPILHKVAGRYIGKVLLQGGGGAAPRVALGDGSPNHLDRKHRAGAAVAAPPSAERLTLVRTVSALTGGVTQSTVLVILIMLSAGGGDGDGRARDCRRVPAMPARRVACRWPGSAPIAFATTH